MGVEANAGTAAAAAAVKKASRGRNSSLLVSMILIVPVHASNPVDFYSFCAAILYQVLVLSWCRTASYIRLLKIRTAGFRIQHDRRCLISFYGSMHTYVVPSFTTAVEQYLLYCMFVVYCPCRIDGDHRACISQLMHSTQCYPFETSEGI